MDRFVEQDYYAVLGVDRTADLATLRTAYYRLAKRWHPDRGGSGAQMNRINAAWEILRDPETRRRYDAILQGRADAATQSQFRQEAAAADAAAAEYPAEWDEFERWYRSVAQDFASADYGESWAALEIKHSASGWAFVKTGMICGGLLGIYLAWDSAAAIGTRFRIVAFFGIAGALLGKGLHYGLRSVLVSSSPGTNPKTTSQPPAQSQPRRAQPAPPSPDSFNAPPPRFQFACCPGCAKNLRMPDPPPSDTIKCPVCGYRFSLRAAR